MPKMKNGYEIVSGARFHAVLFKANRGFQPNEGMIAFDADTLPGNDKNVILGAEIEIECGRKVRQKPGIRPLNRKTRRKGSHDFSKLPWRTERHQFFENVGEGNVAR